MFSPSMLASFGFSCNKSTAHICNACQLGKHTRLPFTPSVSVTYFPFQLLHADVWTSPIASVSGFQFYLVILDDYSHYVWTFPLRHKSDVTPTLLSFHSYVCTQFQRPIVALQTDNGREFDNHALRTFLASHGVSLRFSCPYTSQQNGKAERILRTLNDGVRMLLFHSAVPPVFWAEALATMTYLLNRRPCTSTGTTTPHQLLLGAPPDYTLLRVFGCACYPNLTATTTNKLSPRTTRCIFFGYLPDHHGYRCYDPTTRRVFTSRHVVFDELSFPFRATVTPTPQSPPASSHDPASVVVANPLQVQN